jgi:6-phosphofructokinase
MDNDVRNTEYCIGFSTAITRAMDAIDRQRTTVGSHERIGVFRVFGRDAGYTALYTAYVTSLRCCIPEYKVELPKLIELLVNDKRNNPSNYSLVILSEGAEWQGYTVKEYGEPDAFGHRKKMSVAEDLRFGGPHGRRDLRRHGDGCHPEGRQRVDDRHRQRMLHHGPDPRSQARPPQGRGGNDV